MKKVYVKKSKEESYKNRCEGQARWWSTATPEMKKARGDKVRAKYALMTKEERKREKVNFTEQGNANRIAALKKSWGDPVNRAARVAKMSQKRKEFWANPENKEKMRKLRQIRDANFKPTSK